MNIQKHLTKSFATVSAVVVLAGLNSSHAETLYGLTPANSLRIFDSATPGSTVSRAVTGLGNETLLGIDFRPQSSVLYGVSNGRRLYTIDPFTGAATVVSATPFATNVVSSNYGFDFNPTVDRIRLVTDQGENLRLNPTNGVLVAGDAMLAYNVGDSNFGLDPRAAGAAYANNVPNALTTSLFVIDWALDILALQNPANSGVLTTIGGLGVNTTQNVGFDISGLTGVAFASLTDPASSLSSLYQINLATGAASLVGGIGGASPLIGLAATIPEPGTFSLALCAVSLAIIRRAKRKNS